MPEILHISCCCSQSLRPSVNQSVNQWHWQRMLNQLVAGRTHCHYRLSPRGTHVPAKIKASNRKSHQLRYQRQWQRQWQPGHSTTPTSAWLAWHVNCNRQRAEETIMLSQWSKLRCDRYSYCYSYSYSYSYSYGYGYDYGCGNWQLPQALPRPLPLPLPLLLLLLQKQQQLRHTLAARDTTMTRSASQPTEHRRQPTVDRRQSTAGSNCQAPAQWNESIW